MNIKKFKIFLKEWLLPPGFSRHLERLIYAPQKGKQDWSDESIDVGLHDLPFFRREGLKADWTSLGSEVRAATQVSGSVELRVKIEPGTGSGILFGVGQKSRRYESSPVAVRIFLDDVEVGAIENLPEDAWHDVRLPVKPGQTCHVLRILCEGGGDFIVSHPIIFGKADAVKSDPRTRPNIICLLLDGVDPALLTSEFAPHMTRFFSKGRSCRKAFSQSEWTLPAISSILTGRYPSAHGVFAPRKNQEAALPASFPTMADLLRAEGYRTFAISGAHRFNPAYGHAKGFERFLYHPLRFKKERDCWDGVGHLLRHLESHRDDPNFAFLHFFDTHYPFLPDTYLKQARLSARRDYGALGKGSKNPAATEHHMREHGIAKVRDVDLSLSALFNYIDTQEWGQDAYVILTSDHGQTKDFYKSTPFLRDAAVHVPLLCRGPGIEPGEEMGLIEASVDLFASIVHLGGAAIPRETDGRLWPFLEGKQRDHAFMESLYPPAYEAAIKDRKRTSYLRTALSQKDTLPLEESDVYVMNHDDKFEIVKQMNSDARHRIREEFLKRKTG